MLNKLKLLMSSMLAVGLVACWTDVDGNAKNQKPLQKSVQNESGNLATFQSDAKGGVVIRNIPTVGNQDVVIKLIPVDASNEGRYIEYSLARVAGSGAYSSSASVLMPHRQYKIQVEGLNQGESLKLSFKRDEALGDVLVDSVPPIFARIMKDNKIFSNDNYSLNGKSYYKTNDQNNISNIPVLSNNVITPFYAGNINIVNESGDSVAQVKVGEYTNPVFENNLVPNAKHPLLGIRDNLSEGYKFSISDGRKSGQAIGIFNGYNTDGTRYALMLKSGFESVSILNIPQELPINILDSEGRYLPEDLLIARQNKSGNSSWVDYELNSKYLYFATTLPLPIVFRVYSVDYVSTEHRACFGSVFYNNDNDNTTIYSSVIKNGDINKDISNGYQASINEWTSAYCIKLNSLAVNTVTNKNYTDEDFKNYATGRFDVGIIDDYDFNRKDSSGRVVHYAMRYAW